MKAYHVVEVTKTYTTSLVYANSVREARARVREGEPINSSERPAGIHDVYRVPDADRPDE